MAHTIAKLSRVCIDGGRRVFLVSLAPREIVRTLAPATVNVAIIPS